MGERLDGWFLPHFPNQRRKVGKLSERGTESLYRYRQRLNSIRRWRVRYCLSASNQQRESVAFIDLRASNGYPWNNTRDFIIAWWDIYRITVIAFSSYCTAYGLSAFFDR